MKTASRGLRGSQLEYMINVTNDRYDLANIAIVQKIPTPITPCKMEGSRITLAYFAEKSTVDYVGVTDGTAICFDAKECNDKNGTFALKNIHKHQIEHMKKFQEQGGVSFIIIWFKNIDRFYFATIDEILSFFKRMEDGGKKSVNLKELNEKYFFDISQEYPVPYIRFVKEEKEKTGNG